MFYRAKDVLFIYIFVKVIIHTIMDDHGISSECYMSIVNMIHISTNVLMIKSIKSFFATMVGGSM